MFLLYFRSTRGETDGKAGKAYGNLWPKIFGLEPGKVGTTANLGRSTQHAWMTGYSEEEFSFYGTMYFAFLDQLYEGKEIADVYKYLIYPYSENAEVSHDSSQYWIASRGVYQNGSGTPARFGLFTINQDGLERGIVFNSKTGDLEYNSLIRPIIEVNLHRVGLYEEVKASASHCDLSMEGK